MALKYSALKHYSIHSHKLLIDQYAWGGSSAGRASRSQCEGREFDPPPLHHTSPNVFHHLAALLPVPRVDVFRHRDQNVTRLPAS